MKVLDSHYKKISPFVELLERKVEVGDQIETFHGIKGNDYVCIIGLTSDGRIPLVRQFRPVVNKFTWELPAGTVDAGERPTHAAEVQDWTGGIPAALEPSSGRQAVRT